MSLYLRIIRPHLLQFSLRCSRWSRTNMSVKARVLTVCIVTGIVAGIGAWCLKSMIRLLSTLITSELSAGSINWIFMAGPCAGIVLTAILQRHVFHRRIAEGTSKIRSYIKSGNYKLPHQLIYEPILGCALTIGMGGSAGAEGPIAYAGAAMGSNSARFFGLDPQFVRIMIGIGAGTGIAAIFKAPLAGVFYTLEVLAMPMTSRSVLALVACCLISGGTVYALSGFHEEIIWLSAQSDFDYSQTAWLIVIGAVTGLYSKWYVKSGSYAGHFCRNIKKPIVHNLCAGVAVGSMVLVFPAMFGEGYSSIEQILGGETRDIISFSPFTESNSTYMLPIILAGILFFKGAAVSVTDKGGGIAGTFAPTLFAGCVAGALISFSAQYTGCQIPASQIAYMCMGGAMAGIIGAPLMATFITVEVTMTYAMLMPVAIVAFTSYAVSRTWFSEKVRHSLNRT